MNTIKASGIIRKIRLAISTGDYCLGSIDITPAVVKEIRAAYGISLTRIDGKWYIQVFSYKYKGYTLVSKTKGKYISKGGALFSRREIQREPFFLQKGKKEQHE